MIKEKALAYHRAGFNVLPTNGKKLPTVQGWKEYQDNRQPAELVQSWEFSSVAILGGVGGVECFDIDTKNDPTGKVYGLLCDQVKKKLPDLLDQVVIQRTPSGGYHWVYKTEKVEPSKVLAANDQKKAVLETRGKGGYFLAAPSPGYELVQGDFTRLPILKQAIRNTLFLIAKQFDMRVQPKQKNGTREALERQIKKLEQNRIDITADYNDWIRIGFGLQAEFGEAGRDLYHRISQLYTGYDPAETDKQYDACLKDTGTFKARINTVFGVLSDYGVSKSNSNTVLRAENRTEPATPAPTPAHSKEKANKYLIKHQAIVEYLDQQKLKYNEITCHIEKPGGENLSDWDVNTMSIEILTESGVNVGVETLNRYIWSDTIERYNPILEYLEELPKGKTGELKKLINTIEFKDANMRTFVEKWLVSLVAAAYGNVPELVLVLIGEQGCGKTMFFSNILPARLQNYFAVDKLDQGKDSDILMTQKLLILDDEFYGKSKKDAEHFKSITSRHKFSIRKPYGRISEDMRRLAVLAGASNKSNIINDNTGNRRILPVEITARDFAGYDAIDRDKLFQDLVYYYETLGEESYKLNKEQRAYLDSINDDYQLVNSERELLLTYVKPITKEQFTGANRMEREDNGYEFRTASSIAGYLEKQAGLKLDVRKIGQELNQAGFERDKRRPKGVKYPVAGYYVQLVGTPELGDDETPF